MTWQEKSRQIVPYSDHHSNDRPFGYWTTFDYSNTRNKWYKTRVTITRLITQKWPIFKVLLTQYLPRDQVTQPWSITFMAWLIQLRYQSFDNSLKDEPRVGTPIRQSLLKNSAKSYLAFIAKGKKAGIQMTWVEIYQVKNLTILVFDRLVFFNNTIC